jgi:SAM-dependent methyltransferase
MTFRNVYEDAARADAYSRLEFPGTYFLAFRDLPSLCERHVTGRRAVDFGCGTGRSTRLLRGLGFEVVGVDISADMIRKARELDPSSDYRLVEPARLVGLLPGEPRFDTGDLHPRVGVVLHPGLPGEPRGEERRRRPDRDDRRHGPATRRGHRVLE